jgi:hypothetical protein
MVTEFGKDTRLNFGDGADPEVFAVLGGEGSYDRTQASTDVDTTDKDGPAGLYVPGRIGWSVSGNVKLPDVGFSRIVAASKSGLPIDLKETFKGTTVRYLGPVTIGNLKLTRGSTGAVPYTFDMTAFAVPTTDAQDALPA